MADEDFDLERLADYLHLTVAQVARLADRGKLPGRKVQGQWRFAQAEIHHWLEHRIGLSDEEELQQMETFLRPMAGHLTPPQSIAEMLPLAAIEVPLLAKTRNSVISTMCEVAARTHQLWDPQKMAEAVRSREELQPTALEIGVALMHPRRPIPSILGEAFFAFGRTEKSNSLRRQPRGADRFVFLDLLARRPRASANAGTLEPAGCQSELVNGAARGGRRRCRSSGDRRGGISAFRVAPWRL